MGAAKKPLDNLLDREMDRKEFLIYLGVLVLTITGISGIINNLSNLKPVNKKETKETQGLTAPTGFGSGPYGI